MNRGGRQRGQATVELALALPVVMVILLAVVQVGLVARSQILVTHAAREAARQAAVDPDPAAVEAAARRTPGLRSDRLSVEIGPRGPTGSLITVTVTYRAPTEVALVGGMVGEPRLQASVTMRVELDGSEPGGP